MQIFGFDISKRKKNGLESTDTTANRRHTLADIVKRGDKIKISKDVFYELYKRNGDIRACVRDIAKRVGVKGLYLEKNGAVFDSKTELASIQKIFNNPTFLDFKVELFKHLMVGGEVFIEPVIDGMKRVVGFNFLDPRTIKKFYRKDTGEITRYEQWVAGASKAVDFTVDELAYYQFEKNPDNNYEGLSLLEGIVYDALTDREAMEKNYEFFENGMMIDGAIILDPEFDADELEIAKEKLQKELGGKGRKMLISNTIKDVKSLSVSPKDIDGINQRKLTIEKVCAAFGTPKFLLGYTEGVQRANGDASYVQYIDGTIGSNQDFAEFIINQIFAKFVKKDVTYTIKLNGEKVDDRTVIEEAQRKDIERGIISIDEARQERGLQAWGKTGLTDSPLIASNIVVLGTVTDAKPQVQK